jgi:zinc D-Ala-D-Ala carboxypeptidase
MPMTCVSEVSRAIGEPVLGMEGIAHRIAQINSQLASLAPPAVQMPPPRENFAAVLQQAVTGGTGAATGKVSAMRGGVPSDLIAYGNGKVPSDALSPINVGQHRLWAPAAQSFQQLSAAAAREGIVIKVTDSYRSLAQQVDVANRKGLYSNGGLAAKPGTSDHGWGLSLDLGLNATAQTWMRANAARFGFREDVPREPWHWTFSPPKI